MTIKKSTSTEISARASLKNLLMFHDLPFSCSQLRSHLHFHSLRLWLAWKPSFKLLLWQTACLLKCPWSDPISHPAPECCPSAMPDLRPPSLRRQEKREFLHTDQYLSFWCWVTSEKPCLKEQSRYSFVVCWPRLSGLSMDRGTENRCALSSVQQSMISMNFPTSLYHVKLKVINRPGCRG